jgi:hypothetical protein
MAPIVALLLHIIIFGSDMYDIDFRSLCRGIGMDIMAMAVTLVLDESVYDTTDGEDECLRLFVDELNEQYLNRQSSGI